MDSRPTLRQFLQTAYDLAETHWPEGQPLDHAAGEVWQAIKTATTRWQRDLSQLEEWSDRDQQKIVLSNLSMTVTSAEMLFRVWATVVSRDSNPAGRRLLSATALHLDQISRGVLRLTKSVPVLETSMAFRRRTERWTDVLIASLASRGHTMAFANDSERSTDFYESALRSRVAILRLQQAGWFRFLELSNDLAGCDLVTLQPIHAALRATRRTESTASRPAIRPAEPRVSLPEEGHAGQSATGPISRSLKKFYREDDQPPSSGDDNS